MRNYNPAMGGEWKVRMKRGLAVNLADCLLHDGSGSSPGEFNHGFFHTTAGDN